MGIREEEIKRLKIEYPTLKSGNDQDGYIDLSAADYEATIDLWADNIIAAQEAEAQAQAEAAALVIDQKNATAKLEALGLTENDLKALGL